MTYQNWNILDGELDSATDVLVEMIHRWYEATQELDTYVRVVMLDLRMMDGFDGW